MLVLQCDGFFGGGDERHKDKTGTCASFKKKLFARFSAALLLWTPEAASHIHLTLRRVAAGLQAIHTNKTHLLYLH